jgi:hypothetical protein
MLSVNHLKFNNFKEKFTVMKIFFELEKL